MIFFNGWRGGKPGRLALSEWRDEVNGLWFQKDKVTMKMQGYFSVKQTFQSGKGDKEFRYDYLQQLRSKSLSNVFTPFLS